MATDPLVEARVLAASSKLAVQSEYLREILRVLLAMHDGEAPAPLAAATSSNAPPKRGR